MSRRRTLLAVQFTNPAAYPPVEHLALLLARRGWRVELRGLLRGAHVFELANHPLVQVKTIPKAPPGWPLVKQYARYTAWLRDEARSLRPDWVWASDSLAALPGLVASAVASSPLVYQEHDAPAGSPARPLSLATLAFRREAVSRAAFCVAPGRERARLLSEVSPAAGDIHVVWNCPRRDEVGQPRQQRDAGEPLILYYHGTLSPDRLPYSLLQAVASLKGRVRLLIRGYDTSGGDDLRRTQGQIQSSGAGEWARLESPVGSRAELWPVVDSCHVGLALVPSEPTDVNMTSMAGPSNKAFDYLARGLGLLVTDRSEWTDLYVRPGYARACTPEDPASIAEELDWFFRNPIETSAMAEAGRRRILDEWNYETQLAPVLARLQRG